MGQFIRVFEIKNSLGSAADLRVRFLTVVTKLGAKVEATSDVHAQVLGGSASLLALKGALFTRVKEFPVQITAVFSSDTLSVTMVDALGEVQIGIGAFQIGIPRLRIGLRGFYDRAFDYWQRELTIGLQA